MLKRGTKPVHEHRPCSLEQRTDSAVEVVTALLVTPQLPNRTVRQFNAFVC